MTDLDNYRNNKAYNGTTEKFGITIHNTDYIVKLPKQAEDLSIYCEHIASTFIRKLGIPCHETYLAVYHGRVAVVLKDFTKPGSTLHSFKDTKQSSEDTDINTKEYTYDDVLYLIEKHLKMTDTDKNNAKIHFWNMFICDAILGNRDRHWGNWGYLSIENSYKPAPLYDNGACLYPNVNKVIHQYINEDTRYRFLYDRVFTFPASLLKIKKPDRTYRTNYAEMFRDLNINKTFASQTAWIKNNFTYKTIFRIIRDIVSDINSLNEIYKRFYVEIVTLRYMCIVLQLDFEPSYNTVERMCNCVSEKDSEK